METNTLFLNLKSKYYTFQTEIVKATCKKNDCPSFIKQSKVYFNTEISAPARSSSVDTRDIKGIL